MEVSAGLFDGEPRVLEEGQVRETYRYLRIGLIGASMLLLAAIGVERVMVDCWQGSISSYYYTPARGVFVGALVAVGLSLIVIKGRGWEDFFLNMAGMLAPVVAFVPTTNVGECWSIEPIPSPLTEGSGTGDPVLAEWVLANIENNMAALILAGVLGVLLALLLLWRTEGEFLWPFGLGTSDQAKLLGILLVTAIILGTAAAMVYWDDFETAAHNIAAVGMFGFLAAASVRNAWRSQSPIYQVVYTSVATLMVASAGIIWWLASVNPDWDHAILVLEIIQIGLFSAYWIAQTGQHWQEKLETSAA